MDKLVVSGGVKLNGEVTISGAKNAAVAVIPAALLASKGECIIENLPRIADVLLFEDILVGLGAKVEIDEKAAQEGVKNLINEHRDHLRKFDMETEKLRMSSGGDHGYVSNLEKCKHEDLDLQRLDNPDISGSASQLVEIPKSFNGELKEYQLKGNYNKS